MTMRILVSALGIFLLATAPGWAQSTPIPAGNFDSLSPGNQKIANALFEAQHPTGTQTALTRDQIARLKGTEGWGRVFKTMKADGLVQARNLGQVVSGHERSLHASAMRAARGARTIAAARGSARSGRFATHGFARSGGRFSGAGVSGGRGFSGSSPGMAGGFGHGGGFGGGMGGAGHGGGGGHGK
jgi:hypothetical protein